MQQKRDLDTRREEREGRDGVWDSFQTSLGEEEEEEQEKVFKKILIAQEIPTPNDLLSAEWKLEPKSHRK